MIIHLVTASNNSQTCSLFMSQIYQPKMKCKDGGLYFYKNQKYRQLEKEKKKMHFSVISFQEFQVFLYGLFQKIFNVSSEYSFNEILLTVNKFH